MIATLLRPTVGHGMRPTARRKIAAVTGPLAVLADRAVLVLADEENLRCGARDLGYRISHERLGECLRRQTRECAMHAFFSRERGDERRCQRLRACDWIPHPRDIETVWTRRGRKCLANSDNDILFWAGHLAGQGGHDLIVLASGDGELVCDIARNLRQLGERRAIVTLSLAGSTSNRLSAALNPNIDHNIEIGRDCLVA